MWLVVVWKKQNFFVVFAHKFWAFSLMQQNHPAVSTMFSWMFCFISTDSNPPQPIDDRSLPCLANPSAAAAAAAAAPKSHPQERNKEWACRLVCRVRWRQWQWRPIRATALLLVTNKKPARASNGRFSACTMRKQKVSWEELVDMTWVVLRRSQHCKTYSPHPQLSVALKRRYPRKLWVRGECLAALEWQQKTSGGVHRLWLGWAYEWGNDKETYYRLIKKTKNIYFQCKKHTFECFKTRLWKL